MTDTVHHPTLESPDTQTTDTQTSDTPPANTQRTDAQRAESLADFDARIGADDMIGQWNSEALLNAHIGGPKPRGVGYVWPFDLVQQRLLEASDALGTKGDLGRCNLTFLNPGIAGQPRGTTHTISAGMQIVRSGEICGSHRHSMAALRFVVQGHPDAYTAVDGEALHMEQFDLLLTPRFSWHDHHNPTDQDVMWLDVLDVGLTGAMNQIFYETYGAVSQTLRENPAESQQLRSSWLRPTWERARRGRHPIRYRWADVLTVLEGYGDTRGNDFDGLALSYANPITGGPTMQTMDCWVQQLVPGFEGRPHRRTSSSVGYVISGHGSIDVAGTTLTLGPGDTYAVPNWAWQTLRNASSEHPLRLFSVHDTPAIRALGFFYEEPEATLQAHLAPAIPTKPLDPVYLPEVLLDEDEVR